MSALQRSLIGLAALVIILAGGSATAQIPDKFTNLEVLPKDISKRELVSVMRGFASALGKRCNYCHVGENPQSLEGYDFASDEKESKVVARTMMKMVDAINTTYLAELGREDVIRVRCVTCHHGISEPETIDAIVLDVTAKEGVEPAMAKYRELREEYYGSASYDFSSGPLNKVAETLAREREDVTGAIAVMKMNIELNPDDSYPYILLGQLYQASGDTAAAIASVEKSLELEPDNKWAQGLLEKLKAGQ